MLWQLHQHFRDGSSEFYGLIEAPVSDETLHEFVHDLIDKFPLKESAVWQMCNEDMPCFRVQKAEETPVSP
jgi:hypothetical protein